MLEWTLVVGAGSLIAHRGGLIGGLWSSFILPFKARRLALKVRGGTTLGRLLHLSEFAEKGDICSITMFLTQARESVGVTVIQEH